MPRPWTLLGQRELVRAPIFRLVEQRVQAPHTGEAHDFYVLETNDWVNVLAFTENDEIVCVRQYRHGVARVTLEIPGGVMDPGEDPVTSAMRELLEETGFGGGEAPLLIGSVDSNPAILNNRTHTVLVRGVVKRSDTLALDDTEDIEVVVVPWADVPRLVREGTFSHALAVAALALYAAHEASSGEASGEGASSKGA